MARWLGLLKALISSGSCNPNRNCETAKPGRQRAPAFSLLLEFGGWLRHDLNRPARASTLRLGSTARAEQMKVTLVSFGYAQKEGMRQQLEEEDHKCSFQHRSTISSVRRVRSRARNRYPFMPLWIRWRRQKVSKVGATWCRPRRGGNPSIRFYRSLKRDLWCFWARVRGRERPAWGWNWLCVRTGSGGAGCL